MHAIIEYTDMNIVRNMHGFTLFYLIPSDTAGGTINPHTNPKGSTVGTSMPGASSGENSGTVLVHLWGAVWIKIHIGATHVTYNVHV